MPGKVVTERIPAMAIMYWYTPYVVFDTRLPKASMSKKEEMVAINLLAPSQKPPLSM